LGSRLAVPRTSTLRESLFCLAHDSLGHFGGEKSYLSLRNDFYWPNMRRDLVDSYIPGCADCQRNKYTTTRPNGPLHPLPIPDGRLESVTPDFVGPLPEEEKFNCILTMTDRLGCDLQIAPCQTDISAEQLAVIFFDRWYCENGCPLEIISDRDKLFVPKFWKHLMRLSGIKHKLSTSYHPQTDGLSERSNKTIIQAIRFHVGLNQKGWLRALPRVRFDIMNTINASTCFSPFQLKTFAARRTEGKSLHQT
jgi:Integrase zinc binding domain